MMYDDSSYQKRFINGEMPKEHYQDALYTFQLDEAVEAFADCWARGKEALAVGAAAVANGIWNDQYLTETLQNLARARAEYGDEYEIMWPNPGCPEADEATGWEGFTRFGGGV